MKLYTITYIRNSRPYRTGKLAHTITEALNSFSDDTCVISITEVINDEKIVEFIKSGIYKPC